MEIIHFADGNWSQAAVNSTRQILRQIHNFAFLVNNRMAVDSSICHLLLMFDSKIFTVKPASIYMMVLLNIQSDFCFYKSFFIIPAIPSFRSFPTTTSSRYSPNLYICGCCFRELLLICIWSALTDWMTGNLDSLTTLCAHFPWYAAVTLITCGLRGQCGTAELKGLWKVEVRNCMLINDTSMNLCSALAQYKCSWLDGSSTVMFDLALEIKHKNWVKL